MNVSRLGALLLALAGCGAPEPPRARNAILISVDTLRADRLGCYGNARGTSPAIDGLARRGWLFEDCTAAAPWTLPSHASLLSGLFPTTHGVKDVVQRLEAPTLATLLADRGFSTMAVTNSVLVGDPRFGLMRGFEPGRRRLFAETAADPEGGAHTTHAAGEIVDVARGWLASRDERPFFLFLHFYDVHSDYSPGPEWRARFVGPYEGELDGSTAQLIELRKRGGRLSEADREHLLALYDAEIAQLDAQLGRLFATLDEFGLTDDTLVVLTSDHGEEFGEHGGVLHGRTQYQELLHVPLVIAGPGVPAGERVREPVHLVDVAPTMLAALGVESPSRFDGLDLAAALRAQSGLPPRELYAEADHNNLVDGQPKNDILGMVRLGPAKLVFDASRERVELFDLSRDPREQRDLSKDRADSAAQLLERLRRFRERSGDASLLAPLDPETQDLLRGLGYVDDR